MRQNAPKNLVAYSPPGILKFTFPVPNVFTPILAIRAYYVFMNNGANYCVPEI